MTDKSTLLSRIEQIMQLGSPKSAEYQKAAKQKVSEFVDKLFAKHSSNFKPVFKIGNKGQPLVLINRSKKKFGVEPVWTLVSSHLKKNQTLLSEEWLKTKHDPAKPIPVAGGAGTPFENEVNGRLINLYVNKFIKDLTTATKDLDAFEPENFTNKRQTTYENQGKGEGRRAQLGELPTEVAPENPEEEAKQRKLEKPLTLTVPDNPNPHEHYKALHEAIASSLKPEDINKLKNILNKRPSFAPFVENGKIKGDRKLLGEYNYQLDKLKANMVNYYFKKYVDEDGEFTENAPKEWKEAYNAARTAESAHREGAAIAGKQELDTAKDEAGRQFPDAPRPWYEQLELDDKGNRQITVLDSNLNRGQYVTGIWEEKTKKGWKKHEIEGTRVYRIAGYGDIIVQDLMGMRTRVFAPSKDMTTGRVNSNLLKPRILTNDKAVDFMVQAYCEQRLYIPPNYNPPAIKPRDWEVVANIQDKLYTKAVEGAMEESSPKKRKACLKAIEDKYGAWKMARSHKSPEYYKLWTNWFGHKVLETFTEAERAKYGAIYKDVENGKQVSNNKMQFYLKFQKALKKLQKETKKDFNVAFEQRALTVNSKGFSPLDSPDVNIPETDAKKVAEDALNYEINKKVRGTKAGKEYAKWRDLAADSYARIEAFKESPNLTEPQEEQKAVEATATKPAIPYKPAVVGSPYYKKKKDPMDIEDEADEAADYQEEDEEDTTTPIRVDDQGNLVDRGMNEINEDELERILNPSDDKEISTNDEEEEEDKEEIKPSSPTKDTGEKGLEELRLEWLQTRAKRAATQSNIEYAKTKSLLTGKIIKISGLYSEDGISIYDFVATPQGKSHIINTRKASFEEVRDGIYAFDKRREKFFTSAVFDKLARKEGAKTEEIAKLLAGQEVIYQQATKKAVALTIGPEPPPDNPEKGVGAHYEWTKRIDKAAKRAATMRDTKTLDVLYNAFPKQTSRFKYTIDPRWPSPDDEAAVKRRVAERETAFQHPQEELNWDIQNPQPHKGETPSEYTQRREAWGKDLLNKYKTASPRIQEAMSYNYKQFVAANPKEPHPFDKIKELKQERDRIVEAKTMAPVKEAINNALATVTDPSLRTALRRNIQEENKQIQDRAKQKEGDKRAVLTEDMNFVSSDMIPETIKNIIAKIREDKFKQIEQDYNVTIDRETTEFTPNEGGITIPAPKKKEPIASKPKEEKTPPKEKKTPAVEKEPESTTFEDEFFGETKEEPPAEKKPPLEKIKDKIKRVSNKKIKEPLKEKESSIKPKSTRWLDAFNDNFFNKPNSAKIETEKVRPETPPKDKNKSTRWLDAFNDEFFNTSSTPPKSKTTSTEKPAPKPTRWLDAFNDSFFGETS